MFIELRDGLGREEEVVLQYYDGARIPTPARFMSSSPQNKHHEWHRSTRQLGSSGDVVV